MKELKPNELAAVQELRQVLARDYGLVELRLIGSKARGDSGPESDIDVVIVLEDCDWQRKRRVFRLCFELSLKFDVLLAPIVFTRERFNSDRNRTTPFYQNVQREGVLV
jgi:predicted nucleotidyltransferase